MWYYRFKRLCMCASECLRSDVMVLQEKYVIDIEVKISKLDLRHWETRKRKHELMKCNKSEEFDYKPNKFYIAVPEYLYQEAKKWVQKTNKKYGIIICSKRKHYPFPISIKKEAILLHTRIKENIMNEILFRVCAENIELIKKYLIKKEILDLIPG